jgi:UDP-N-acetylglucosamine 2-epimerase (non-hydrolysing)
VIHKEFRIMTVVGARPNFMKAAPILAAVQRHNAAGAMPGEAARAAPRSHIHQLLVHTGQHYDASMSEQFFADLNMPRPDVHLDVGSGSHSVQTAEIMKRFEPVLLEWRPDAVLVVGDVNSTLACALVTSKMAFDDQGARPLIGHVEAGLRSFDRSMPEEINRILTDHLSDLLFVSEPSGCVNLQKEGIASQKVHFVGNTMIDTLLAFRCRADDPAFLKSLGLVENNSKKLDAAAQRPYALLTLHRPANVDNREAFHGILEGISGLARKWPIIFPAHPRTQKRITEFGFAKYFAGLANHTDADSSLIPVPALGIRTISPQGYLHFVCLMKNASLVITDSGGIQEETTILGVPCVTVRDSTERPVTIDCGTNLLAGTSARGIQDAITRQMERKRSGRIPEKWDGHAAERIVSILIEVLERGRGTFQPPQ